MNTATLQKPNQIDCPSEYNKLSKHQQAVLQLWISQHLKPHKQKSFGTVSSYWLKHYFEYSQRGFYITNGALKGAMKASGFEAKDESYKNWTYQLPAKLQRIDFANLPRW